MGAGSNTAQSHTAPPRLSKRLRTRARLIAATVDLVADRGYENTTVEHIADAVEVSARTVANYFPNKEGLLLALVEEFGLQIDAQLARVPGHVPPLRALFDAHLHTLELIRSGTADTDLARVVLLLQTVNASPRLQAASQARHVGAVADRVAERLGVAAADRQVRLVAVLWAGLIGCAWGDLGPVVPLTGLATGDILDLLGSRLAAAFAGLRRVADAEG